MNGIPLEVTLLPSKTNKMAAKPIKAKTAPKRK